MKTAKKLLQEALEFERDCQKKFIKHYPTYIKQLNKYAEVYGFYDFDTMIKELQND